MKIFIASSSESKLSLLFAALFGIASAFVILRVLPMGDKNVLFLLALPLVGLFFLLILIDAKTALILLLFTRASLNYVIELTRVDILGQNIGIGGGINLFVLILALVLMIQKPGVIFESSISKHWIFYLLICALAVVYSPVRGRGARLFLNLLSYYCMLTLPFILINRFEDKKFWLKVLFFSTILPVCFANSDLIRSGTFAEVTEERIQGTLTHPNILAFYLIFVITLVFYIFKCHPFSLNKFGKTALRIYMLNLFVLLGATKTRGAWLACWGLFFLFGLLKERRYLLYSLIAPFLALSIPFVNERVSDAIGPGAAEGNSWSWRLELWRKTLSPVSVRLLFGSGLASFESVSESEGYGAHNTYLQVIFETGVLGIAAYLGIYLKLLRAFYTKARNTFAHLSTEHTILFCYTVSYAIASFGDNMLYYLPLNWYVWFFMGVIMRSMALDKMKRVSIL